MVLGPFSGAFILGKGMSDMASGYSYNLPVLAAFESAGRGVTKGVDMMTGDDAVTTEDVMELVDYIADSASYFRGKGIGKAYEIAKNVSKSIGFTKEDVRRLTLNEVDGQVFDLSAEMNRTYKEMELPDKKKASKSEYKEAQNARWDKLAEEYQKIKDQYPHAWEAIAEQLKEKHKLPAAVESRLR
jgi:hypothetical protein